MYSGVIAYFKASDANFLAPTGALFVFWSGGSICRINATQGKLNHKVTQKQMQQCNSKKIYFNIATWANLNWL